LTTPASLSSLAALCGLRTAPELPTAARQALRLELNQRLAACEWFTVGVMAPSASQAVAALRACENALGWEPLLAPGTETPGSEAPGSSTAGLSGSAASSSEARDPAAEAGPVFLKGNQRTGLFLVRPETGLGCGLLITGHSSVAPEAEDTWGPFPLDFFA
jgi:hypothetical protein